MTKYLCDNILINILSFGCKNIIYLDKRYYYKIKKLRKIFLNNPLEIKYKLIKWRLRDSNVKYRPSIHFLKEKKIYLYGKNKFGKIKNKNEIIPSLYLTKKIKPKDKYVDSVYFFYKIYYTIKRIWCDDIEKLILYNILIH